MPTPICRELCLHFLAVCPQCPLQSRSLRAVRRTFARAWGGLRMLTHFCPFPGPLPPPHPLHAVPGGLQPARPFNTRVSLGLPGLFLSFYLPLLGQFNPKCLKVESKGRSKIKLKHKARESASGGGPPGRLKDRGGCRASCQHARPLCGAGPASAHRMGLRKCSCQESEASLGSLKKVTQESASRAVASPPPHPPPAPYQLQAGSLPHLHSPAPAGPPSLPSTWQPSRFHLA